MLDTLTAPPVQDVGDLAKDPTGAERQRRFREKRRNEKRNTKTEDRNAVLIAAQPEISIAWTVDGDCILTQESWPEEAATIVIGRGHQQQFLDSLCDAFGIVTSIPG
jgi:hypothetical protein